MTEQDTKLLVESLAERAALADRNKLQPMLGVVVEIGTGEYDGMVRVRREPHEPEDVGRGFYYVVGNPPALDDAVWCMSNFATGFVFGDFVGAGYETISEGGSAAPAQAH